MMPDYVANARKRAFQLELDPTVLPAFVDRLSADGLLQRQHDYSEVLSIASFFFDKLLRLLDGSPVLFVVSDSEAYLLNTAGDPTMQEAVVTLGIRPGVRFTQRECGPNGINLALDENRPVRVIGEEHVHHFLQGVACYAVPLHDLRTGALLGSVSLMTTVHQANDYLLAVLVTAVDSIERELLLRQQNLKLDFLNRLMLESTPNAMIVADSDGVVREFNHLAAQYFGVDGDAVIGTNVAHLPQIGHYMAESLGTKTTFESIEVDIPNAATQSRTACLFDCVPILDLNHNVLNVVGQLRDISERLESEQALLRAEKLSVAGQLGAALAHEIRNPLTSVQGLLQLILESDELPRHYIPIMISELKRIEGIISEFLQSTKLQHESFVACDVVAIVQSSMTLIEPMANMASVKMLLNSTQANALVLGDPARLKQVFVNLLRNAVESMTLPGNVLLSVQVDLTGGIVCVEITDEGCGIDSLSLTRIGTPFYSTKEKGTGLGLTISSQIVERHRGTMTFQSEREKGTTVSVILPLASLPE